MGKQRRRSLLDGPSFPKNKGFFAAVHGSDGAGAMAAKSKAKAKAKSKAKLKAGKSGVGSWLARRSGSSAGGGASASSKGPGASLVVAGSASFTELVSQSTAASINPQRAGPFRSEDQILLVGEGSFSFACALTTVIGGDRLVASSLDSLREVLDKYGVEAKVALSGLRSSGVKVHHDVDATVAEDLERCLGQHDAFDVVAFNFPHLGGATKEALKANQDMLSGFFKAAKTVLRTQDPASKARPGRVYVTLRSTPFYDSWDIEGLAAGQGYRLLSKERFDKEDFKGYREVRTNPAFRDSPDTNNAFTSIFVVEDSTPQGTSTSMSSSSSLRPTSPPVAATTKASLGRDKQLKRPRTEGQPGTSASGKGTGNRSDSSPRLPTQQQQLAKQLKKKMKKKMKIGGQQPK